MSDLNRRKNFLRGENAIKIFYVASVLVVVGIYGAFYDFYLTKKATKASEIAMIYHLILMIVLITSGLTLLYLLKSKYNYEYRI
jgi:uncharacterized membrane protein